MLLKAKNGRKPKRAKVDLSAFKMALRMRLAFVLALIAPIGKVPLTLAENRNVQKWS